MIKWSMRLLVLLGLALAGLYFFRIHFTDGKMIVEPRPETEQQKIQHVVEKALPQNTVNKPIKPPQDTVSNKDREALESLLEEEQ